MIFQVRRKEKSKDIISSLFFTNDVEKVFETLMLYMSVLQGLEKYM